MKKITTTSKYTLMECILVIAMLSFLMISMISFLYKGTTLCKQYSKHAFANQQIMILKNKWRKFIHKCGTESFSVSDDGQQFTAGKYSVKTAGHNIIFRTADKQTASYRLSKNITIAFSAEKCNNHPLAIMNITIKPIYKGNNSRSIRIVASPEIRNREL